MTVDELKAFNGLDSDMIIEGQTLLIPAPTPTPGPTPTVNMEAAPANSTNDAFIPYLVKRGDTLSGIAEQYGVSLNDLLAANNLPSNTQDIQEGQALLIPHYTPTPAAAEVTPAWMVEGTGTPGVDYGTPTLLYPANGITFMGTEELPVLQWVSVGVLGENEYYRIELITKGESGSVLTVDTTRATAWRVPEELLPPAGVTDRKCIWRLTVVRALHSGADVRYEPLGPSTPDRWFTWNAPPQP